MKKVLFASSEVIPFIKTGGLADVAGSLPKCFPKSEYDVRVVLPKYLCMKESFCDGLTAVAECEVHLNWRTQYAGIYQTVEDGVTFYFIDNEYYFAGPKPYGEIYQDAEKFAFFSKAVLTILPVIDFQPDIIHCHDWQTGLVPVFLEGQFRQEAFYRHIRTIFTIHNLKFQGRWYIDAIRDVTGLPPEYFTMETLESYGQANLLKGGLVYADYITTVSETYAKEIQSPDGGEGLDGLLRAKGSRLTGILNGLDYKDQDPATDERITQKFEGDIVSYKRINKADLQRSLGLEEREDAFLIGMVSRLTDQKGFDLVNYILDEIMGEERIQIVVLGTGEYRYESMFQYYEGKYPGRISANIYYSEELAQKIYASCDAFLMPSLFEPCGLSQLMSMRYGTVPLVRETGGLKDTVEPYNEFEHTGTGFSFHNYNAHEMLYMIRYACKVFSQTPEEWLDIIRRDM
ncbi:MAG: glycogen synthase GlgA, partial [Clostridiales bacterium]|nr:glycogen synthase GlgA [Clostridiales bacterium]